LSSLECVDTLPHLLLDNSSASRSNVIEIGEISDEAAVDYLLHRGVPKERAADAVSKITGGRLMDLVGFAEKYHRFSTNAEYRKKKDHGTDGVLIDLKLSKDDDFFKHLLNHGGIGSDDAKKMLANEQIDDLLKHNIPAQHPDNLPFQLSRCGDLFPFRLMKEVIMRVIVSEFANRISIF